MARRMPWQHIDEVFISFKTFRMSGEVIRLMTQADDNLKLTVTVRCWSGSNGASVGKLSTWTAISSRAILYQGYHAVYRPFSSPSFFAVFPFLSEYQFTQSPIRPRRLPTRQ